MYLITFTPAVKKDFKKLDKQLLLVLKTIHFSALSHDPYSGELLKGKYRKYRKYKFNFNGVAYRVAYGVGADWVDIISVGTRENFYKELKRRVKSRRPAPALVALFLAVLAASLALGPWVARGEEEPGGGEESGGGQEKTENAEIVKIRVGRFGLNAVAELLGIATKCETVTENGIPDVRKCEAPDLRQVILKLIQVVLGFTSLLVLIFVLYGGFTWTTAAGNAERVDKGRKILIWAGAGLVAVLLAWSVVTYVFYTASRVVA